MSEKEFKKMLSSEDFINALQSFYKAQADMLIEVRTLSSHVNDLKNKVEPVCEAYETSLSFGKGAKFIAKWVFTPLVVIVGFLLTIKNLIK